jgi:hypothetical protein
MGSDNLKVGSVVVACASFMVLALACQPAGYGEDSFAGSKKDNGDDGDSNDKPAKSSSATPTATGSGVAAPDAGSHPPLPAPRPSASVFIPSPPVVQTFALGANDCAGGHCNGGYDDRKDMNRLPTATKQCLDRGFSHATDFTIGDQPGDRFCAFNGKGYDCDGSCSGCNIMRTITCVK